MYDVCEAFISCHLNIFMVSHAPVSSLPPLPHASSLLPLLSAMFLPRLPPLIHSLQAYDVVAVMYLCCPELFEVKEGRVEVECEGRITRGASIPDWRGRWGRPNNCTVLRTVQADRFCTEFVKAVQFLVGKSDP